MYAAVLAESAAPHQTSGPLKPTSMDSDPSESAVSTETVNRRMSSDMSGTLSGKPDGTTPNAQWPTPACPQGSVLIRTPFLFQVHVHPCLPDLVAGVLPWRSEGPT